MILRVDEGCRGRAVVEQALGKYGELLDAANDPETTAAYAPPSISSVPPSRAAVSQSRPLRTTQSEHVVIMK